MAIVSISRIQHRRGLKADLPVNLNEGELGWCLDTRELYIGNGNTFTGNTQVLTVWSNNSQLINHTYVGDTGVPAVGAVPRTLGAILDDYLNVKDYGAIGNGVADDTAAIQQAINDEWARLIASPSQQMSRSTINFPAGTYKISASIKLLPYITLNGEGVNRTSIVLASGASGPVFVTADSLGQTGANIGTNGGIIPTSINVKNMSVDGSTDALHPVVLLQRCSGITLSSVSITGAWLTGSAPSTASPGIVVQSLGNAVVTSDITFSSTNIKHCSNAVVIDDPVTRVIVSGCQMTYNYNGIALKGGASGPSYVQITNSEFRHISAQGLYVSTTNRGVSSVNNMYSDVGSIAGVPAIYWASGSHACTSIGDVFSSEVRALQIYDANPSRNLVLDAQQTGIVTNAPEPLTATLTANQVDADSGVRWSLSGNTSCMIQVLYSITWLTYRRSGTLLITSDGTNATLVDSASPLNNDVSLSFNAVVSAGNIDLLYTSTGSGTGTMKYIQTLWNY